MLDALVRDVRLAVRVLRRRRAFTATAIATLAVVIGANTAVLSVADRVLWRPLPFPEPDQLALAEVHVVSSRGQGADVWVDGTMWEAIRDRVTAADCAVYVGGTSGVNFNLGSSAVFVTQQRVGSGFFRVLGVAPWLGREFTLDDDRPSGPKVAVLSYRFWRKVFGGDQAVIGRRIMLRGEPYEVVGVMPTTFDGIDEADLWTPLRPTRTGEGSGVNYQVVMRLHPGATWSQLDAELSALSAPDLFASMFDASSGARAWLAARPMQSALAESQRQPMLLLTSAVAMVLLIACVNIASLLLAHGSSRRKELATRMALGGGRGAVIRQVLMESLVVASIGGAAGAGLGILGLAGLQSLAGTAFADWQRAVVDGRVLAATAGLTIAASLVFGLVPAWQASRIDVRSGLTEGGSRGVAGSSRHWLRRGLVVFQVALVSVLLVCAGLLTRTFVNLSRLDPGFDPIGVTTARVSLQDARYVTAPRITRLFDDSLARIAATPGVEAAAVSLELPYTRLLNLGARFTDEENSRTSNVSYVTDGFRRTFGIPLRLGRDFTPADRAGAPPVVLVNEAFARLYSKDRDVVGRQLQVSGATREIVGVIGDVRQRPGFITDGMVAGPVVVAPAIFVPAAQLPDRFFTLVHEWFTPVWSVRGPASDAGRTIEEALRATDPSLPVAAVQTMTEVRASALAEQRLLMTLVGAVAVAALLLAAMGLYGLIAQTAAERTREFGIRLALGATAGQTVRAVASSGIVMAAIGALAGGACSLLTVRLVQSSLWGVDPVDPLTFVGVFVFLLAVAVVSSVWPALHLLRLDPATTLRE